MNGDRYNRFLIYAPTAILIIVAAIQAFRVSNQDLSPWKGGGFGMFSTIDAPTSRYIAGYLITENELVPIAIPQEYQKEHVYVCTLPSMDSLKHLAEMMAPRIWITEEQSAAGLNPQGKKPTGEPSVPEKQARALRDDEHFPHDAERVSVLGVHLEVWRYRYSLNNNLLKAEKVIQIDVSK